MAPCSMSAVADCLLRPLRGDPVVTVVGSFDSGAKMWFVQGTLGVAWSGTGPIDPKAGYERYEVQLVPGNPNRVAHMIGMGPKSIEHWECQDLIPNFHYQTTGDVTGTIFCLDAAGKVAIALASNKNFIYLLTQGQDTVVLTLPTNIQNIRAMTLKSDNTILALNARDPQQLVSVDPIKKTATIVGQVPIPNPPDNCFESVEFIDMGDDILLLGNLRGDTPTTLKFYAITVNGKQALGTFTLDASQGITDLPPATLQNRAHGIMWHPALGDSFLVTGSGWKHKWQIRVDFLSPYLLRAAQYWNGLTPAQQAANPNRVMLPKQMATITPPWS